MTAPLEIGDLVSLLRFNISNRLKQDFVGKDQVIDLLIISAITREHLLLVGPPGTAKSELIHRFVLLLGASKDNGDLFEYLLTRFTEPNEIFGPVNIKEFQSGTFTRNIEKALPQARVAFLDEVFKANSAILNALLTILNERFFFNGLEQIEVPLISLFGATNEVPEGGELAALYDRFLLRVRTDNVEPRRVRDLLRAGWSMERERIRLGRSEEIVPVFDSLERLNVLYDALERIELEPVFDEYQELLHQIRSEGISISDRRAVKLLKMIAASALMRGESQARSADLWVLLHVWNTPEQIAALQTIVGPVVERDGNTILHAERSLEELATELTHLTQRMDSHDGQRVYTATYYGALVHDIERLRRELLDHSARQPDSAGFAMREELLGQVDMLLDTVLDRLDGEQLG